MSITGPHGLEARAASMLRRMRRLAILCVLAAGCGKAPNGELTIIAVGQGDCAVFQEGGYTVLVDAGPKSGGFDAGERIINRELRQLGVRDIDLVLLSHPDADHIGGLAAIAKKHRIKQIIAPAAFKDHPDMVSALAETPKGTVTWLTEPIQAQIGQFRMRLDAPAWREGMQDNDGSMFVWLGSGKSTAVFTGDAGIEAEAEMLRRRPWTAQIAHLGHHGSMTSTSEAWLNSVQPKFALISCGRENRYGHPHREVLSKVQSRGIRELRTDRDGTIRFVAGPSGFERK